MTFYCLGEPSFTASSWHKRILDGLLEEIKRKRYDAVFLENGDALDALIPESDGVMLLIGTDAAWVSDTVSRCAERFGHRIVLLGNAERDTVSGRFSVVSADVSRNVQALYSYLLAAGGHTVALYGINPRSASDRFRKNAFLAAGGKEENVFYNETGLADCFTAFAREGHRFDAVLCANDLCAVSLLRALDGASMDAPLVASCDETLLARRVRPSVTNLQTRYGDFGRAAIHLARLLVKNPTVSTAEALIESAIAPGDSTRHFPAPTQDNAEPAAPAVVRDGFYEDPEVSEMIKLEALLRTADENDLLILSRLIRGESYEKVAEAVFLSVGGIKYKLSRLCTACGFASKSEMLALFGKYSLTEPSEM
ncbi:MAG: LacI family DNA-binding transcriptional regulator [Clostridia bacterium]|nr:LacI family DNA-binding transcriptional regulator [Clostridia bacterium]